MPKRIQIAPHLSIEELYQSYRQASNPIERSHYQIIWLLASGKRTEEVSSRDSICDRLLLLDNLVKAIAV